VKTISGKKRIVLCALLVAFPMIVQAQRVTLEEVYGGFSYARTDDHPNVNAFGWEALYSEYPDSTPRWLGGSIEANGVYANPVVSVAGQPVNGLLTNQIYTFMGGPTVKARTFRRLQPYAHVLLGAVLTRMDTTGKGALYFGHPISESKTAFGLAVGGGIDFKVKRAFAVRGNADWLRSTFEDQNIDRQNSLRTSLGIVLKF
jgi:opacity protein-like surface antigen